MHDVAPAHVRAEPRRPRRFIGGRFARVIAIRASSRFFAGTIVAILAGLGGRSHAEPKREVPDYDGRGNQDADAESWALWIPRVALSPLYVANEYLLRRPLGAFISHAEREHWAETLLEVFTFGEDHRHLIVPTALYDFGLLPCVGFYYASERLLAENNQLRIHAATWGERWINATAADRYLIGKSDQVQARFEFKRSQDNLFFGIGPDVTDRGQSRFGLERIDGRVSYRRQLASASHVEVESGVRRISFADGQCCGDPSLDAQVAAGQVMSPPGYREPYTAGYGRVAATLDSRRAAPAPGSGGYLSVQARPSFDLDGGRSWLQYGGAFGGALDLTGRRRTLRAQLAFDFVDSMTGGSIPFTEYPVLGGEEMPGFVEGWMTDRSTIAGQLAYTWPVWIWLDAQARFTIGNAFGEHLAGLTASKLRMSADLGFTTSTAKDRGFEVLLGLGTETFEQGAGITSVRVTVGTRRGF